MLDKLLARIPTVDLWQQPLDASDGRSVPSEPSKHSEPSVPAGCGATSPQKLVDSKELAKKKKLNIQRKFEYPKTHTKRHNRVYKKRNEYPTSSHDDEPGGIQTKFEYPLEYPGSICLG